MKKLLLILFLGLIITGLAAAQVARGGTLYVAVRTVDLKSSTGFFASNRGRLNYGDRVTVIQVSGRFVEVRSAVNPSLTGWTPSANMSVRQIVTGTTSTETTREVALAGKGFDQEIEDAYRTQNRELNYSAVNEVESLIINEDQLIRFLEEGRLSMGDN
ncbi:MAG: hypothetical protein FWD24_02515 [Treponema sp.]|nr:hypothetical protein [Treponema sp.]